MDSNESKIEADWNVQVRVWVERNGTKVLGKGRAELLQIIDRTHSISAAAREMRMSYRRAWMLVHQTNEAAGTPLVSAAVGGKHGGGATLTEDGRKALAAFLKIQSCVQSAAKGKSSNQSTSSRNRKS